MSSLIRKGSRSPMSRNSLTSTRRNRAVWDRPATGTRLLLSSFPYPVSLGNAINPLRMTLIASAPSRPPYPQRHLAADACGLLPQMISLGYPGHRASGFAADARVPSPRMITHGSYPQRACPTTVDACGIAPRMISRFTLIGVEADACGIAPRMISHVPSQAAEGALATLILTLSQSLSLRPSSSRRDNWPVAPGRGIPAPLHPRKETV